MAEEDKIPATDASGDPVAGADDLTDASETPDSVDKGQQPDVKPKAAPKAARSRTAKPKPEAPAVVVAEDEGPSARAPRGARAKKAPAATRAKTTSERGAYVRTPAAPSEQGARKERRGVVTSDKGEKSITVRVDEMKRHRKYKKIMRRSIKLNAHDERNEAKTGDVVRIVETRPLSKTKRWRLVEIVEVAK